MSAAASASAPSTSIYQFHVDSRNRDTPLTTTPSSYTVRLGTTVPRVKTIQVGDVQLPTEARNGVDYARRHLGLSTPLKMSSASTLSFSESTTLYDRASGSTLLLTSKPATTVVFPATANRVTSVSTNTLSFGVAHGMDSVLAYWPADQTASLVSARTVNYVPPVSAATLDPTTPFPSDTSLTLSSSAVSTLLSHTVGPLTTLGAAAQGASDNAVLYVPPLTIPEWIGVVNAALADLTASAALTQSYGLTLNPSTGLVELRVVSGDIVTRSTRQTTTAAVTVTEGDIMWRLGFPVGTWPLRTYLNARLDTTGVVADQTPYIMAVVPRDVSTIQVARGRYDAAGLAGALTLACNSLYLDEALASAARTLTFTDTSGQDVDVIVPAGRYTPAQMAAYLQASMNASPTVAGDFVVTVVPNLGDGTGGLTIADGLGRPFALDFSDPAAAPLAAALGFEGVRMSNAASYTSTLNGWSGQNTAGPDTDTSLVVEWAADTTRRRLRAVSSKPIPTFDGVVGATVGGSPNTNLVVATQHGTGASGTPVAPHLMPLDLLELSDGTNSVTVMALDAAAGATVSETPIAFGAVLLGTDLNTGVPALTGTPLGRPDFVLHMAPLPVQMHGTPQDETGSAIVNPALGTLGTAPANVGSGEAYGPIFGQVGFPPTVTQATPAGIALAPSAYTLDPPPYVFLSLLAPTVVSERSLFVPTAGVRAPRPVLAKFIVSNGYARITEESTHVSVTSSITLSQVQLAWYNPDGTLVDWNGAEHSFSLLLRVTEGRVAGVGYE